MAVLKQQETLPLAEKAVNAAEKRGAEESEAFVYTGLNTAVQIERGQIARSSRVIDRGLGVRVIVNKALGFSYTNKLDDESAVEETVRLALKSAKASKPDEEWHGLPTRKKFPSVKDTYDTKIVELRSEDLVETASLMLDTAEEADDRVFPVQGGVGASYLCKAVANSHGVEVSDQGTIMECSLATIGKEKNEVTPMCFEFNMDRRSDVDARWVGKEAARLAVSALKAKRTETRDTNVIFTPFALQQLLQFTLINAVKADYVQRDQSAFKGQIGERVASSAVTIYDDGLLTGGIRTWKFDGEGVPQQKTPIIEKGVLRSFIYDSYTAHKEGRRSTGNASRAGYKSTPEVKATNFHLLPGNRSPEQILTGLKDGLLVYFLQGAHSSNPASGEFSVVATPAWKIEDGEIAYSTKGAMLTGNVFQLLMNISELADNERKIGQLVAPWIAVENVKVVGK